MLHLWLRVYRDLLLRGLHGWLLGRNLHLLLRRNGRRSRVGWVLRGRGHSGSSARWLRRRTSLVTIVPSSDSHGRLHSGKLSGYWSMGACLCCFLGLWLCRFAHNGCPRCLLWYSCALRWWLGCPSCTSNCLREARSLGFGRHNVLLNDLPASNANGSLVHGSTNIQSRHSQLHRFHPMGLPILAIQPIQTLVVTPLPSDRVRACLVTRVVIVRSSLSLSLRLSPSCSLRLGGSRITRPCSWHKVSIGREKLNDWFR